MPTIRRFEDVEAWKKTRILVNEIYQLTKDEKFLKDFNLRGQIKRAVVSIMLNIAEGFARKTNREFKQFLVQAHGSAAEVQSALYIALDQKYISDVEFNRIYTMTSEVSRMVMSLSKYLELNSMNSKNSITL
jgi:four helix bundle protein